jgi:hypothetical protein
MPTASELVGRLKYSPDKHEERMKHWDSARKLVASGSTGSYPRDIMESVINELEEDAQEAAVEIERLEAERDEWHAAYESATKAFNAWMTAGTLAQAQRDKLAASLKNVDGHFCQFINCYGDPSGDAKKDAAEEKRNIKALYDAFEAARATLSLIEEQ